MKLTGPQLQMLRDAAADFDGERTVRVRSAGDSKVARRLEELCFGLHYRFRRGASFVINEDGIEEVDAHV